MPSTAADSPPPFLDVWRKLLVKQRVAALGTLDDDGLPFVSMVPFAMEPAGATLVIHVSALATHTRHLRNSPQVSLLIMQAAQPDAPVHALPRVTIQGLARVLDPASVAYGQARAAYLARFADAQDMTEWADFSFVSIELLSARLIAGFGLARSVDSAQLSQLLRHIL